MPKSDTLPLRRWPCWPGPYSRRLTGLLGRPKTFSPIRRSSLYLALERFDMSLLQFAFPKFPGAAPPDLNASGAAAASPGVRGQLRRRAHVGWDPRSQGKTPPEEDGDRFNFKLGPR